MQPSTPHVDPAVAELPECVAQDQNDADRLFERLQSGLLTAAEQAQLGQLLIERQDGSMLMAMRASHFSGPLPPPEVLNGYDAETRRLIVQMAVDEQKHTHHMEKSGLDGAIKKDRRGQWFGLLIAFAGLGAAAWIAQYSAVAAGIIASIDLLGLVSVFVIPRAFERFGPPGKERQSDDQESR